MRREGRRKSTYMNTAAMADVRNGLTAGTRAGVKSVWRRPVRGDVTCTKSLRSSSISMGMLAREESIVPPSLVGLEKLLVVHAIAADLRTYVDRYDKNSTRQRSSLNCARPLRVLPR